MLRTFLNSQVNDTPHWVFILLFFSLGARERQIDALPVTITRESGNLHYLIIITFQFVVFTEVVSALFLGQVISVHHKNMHAALVLFIAVEAFSSRYGFTI